MVSGNSKSDAQYAMSLLLRGSVAAVTAAVFAIWEVALWGHDPDQDQEGVGQLGGVLGFGIGLMLGSVIDKGIFSRKCHKQSDSGVHADKQKHDLNGANELQTDMNGPQKIRKKDLEVPVAANQNWMAETENKRQIPKSVENEEREVMSDAEPVLEADLGNEQVEGRIDPLTDEIPEPLRRERRKRCGNKEVFLSDPQFKDNLRGMFN